MITSLKLRSLKNKDFPKQALFIFDELGIILKKLSSDEQKKKCGCAKFIADKWIHEERKSLTNYVKQARNLVKTGVHPIDHFFYPDGINNFFAPRYDEIAAFFNITILKDENAALEEYLKKINKPNLNIKFLGKVKSSELMGLLALFWLHKAVKALEHPREDNKKSNIKYLFLACDAVSRAKNFKFYERQRLIIDTGKIFIKQSEKEALRSNALNAVRSRHKATQEIKDQVLNEYDKMYFEALEKGKKPRSKDAFSSLMADKYQGKVSQKTIRTKWLQGYEPTLSK